MFRTLLPFVPALPLLLLASSAHAVVLSAGAGQILPGTSLAQRPELAGTIIADQTFAFSQLSNDPTPDLTLRNYVVRETATGTLDFYYQFNNVGTTVEGPQGSLVLNGFTTTTIDADYRTDIGQSPGETGITYLPTSPNSQVFFFGNTRSSDGMQWHIQPGASLAPFFIRTNATDFIAAGEADIPNVNLFHTAFIPVSGSQPGVPEPATLALLPLALAALVTRHRRHA